MSRLSNRVEKLETGYGLVDLEQLQLNNPGVDLSVLSSKHLHRFAEMQRDTTPRSLAEFSNKELHEMMAFHILFAGHSTGDEATITRAVAAIDDGQEFTTEELTAIVKQVPANPEATAH